jgi:hypothetical protein
MISGIVLMLNLFIHAPPGGSFKDRPVRLAAAPPFEAARVV